MKSTPLLFSTEMVRALLSGRKTQTRRLIKPQPEPFGVSSYKGTRQGWVWKPASLNRSWNDDDRDPYNRNPMARATCALSAESPYGGPGDTLWVRETWAPFDAWIDGVEREDPVVVRYKADGNILRHERDRVTDIDQDNWSFPKWKPSIFMPRWASRITLEITGIRVERVQDISESDARSEGVELTAKDSWKDYLYGAKNQHGAYHYRISLPSARQSYVSLWDSINAKKSPWITNPWVWVIEFKPIPCRAEAISAGGHPCHP